MGSKLRVRAGALVRAGRFSDGRRKTDAEVVGLGWLGRRVGEGMGWGRKCAGPGSGSGTRAAFVSLAVCLSTCNSLHPSWPSSGRGGRGRRERGVWLSRLNPQCCVCVVMWWCWAVRRPRCPGHVGFFTVIYFRGELLCLAAGKRSKREPVSSLFSCYLKDSSTSFYFFYFMQIIDGVS
ncbi:hypothetical protein F5144DRAFT_363688 [Chaetomium tenue]|uniref:Uncharacterized protein n=1 Tax=Chaetomium tenue TaxID=1854479 RepID=A0ACB7P0U8_9PEZI|nr:hypothetical protein F5144DRAFT_363688 [Chaetomium globosum]